MTTLVNIAMPLKFLCLLRVASGACRRRLGAALTAWLLPWGAAAQTNFAVLAQDGVWTWYNDPRALFHNGLLYFGSVRFADGKSVLSVFDPRTGLAANLWAGVRTERDDHDTPALLAEQDDGLRAGQSAPLRPAPERRRAVRALVSRDLPGLDLLPMFYCRPVHDARR